MKTKNISLLIIFILIILSVTAVLTAKQRQENDLSDKDIIQEEKKSIEICYYRSEKTTSGFYDMAWLKLDISGENISGEFHNLPAETDSKIGRFEGSVGKVDRNKMARRAEVIWNSKAEGMENKEELIFEFGDGSAAVFFGEMIDRGDGIYIYKNKDNLYPQKDMWQIDCQDLDEKIFIEKYIRENISSIATNKPVLGGTWYVISVSANPPSNTGEVTYEDGHIQSKANFIYSYDQKSQQVAIEKFEVKN